MGCTEQPVLHKIVSTSLEDCQDISAQIVQGSTVFYWLASLCHPLMYISKEYRKLYCTPWFSFFLIFLLAGHNCTILVFYASQYSAETSSKYKVNTKFLRVLFIFKKETYPNQLGPKVIKSNCPSTLLNHELNVTNHIFLLKLNSISLPTPRPDYCQSCWIKNYLNSTCSEKVK